MKNGTIVRVGLAYRGSGRYAPDGNEGIYTVKRRLGTSHDFYLVKGSHDGATLADLPWDLICHQSRLTVES